MSKTLRSIFSFHRPFSLLRWFSVLSFICIGTACVVSSYLLSRFLTQQMLHRDGAVMLEFVQSVTDIENIKLRAAGREPASAYLLDSRQLGRAWKDLQAIPAWRRKLAYLGSRAFPSPAFVRGKYPAMSRMPLGLLYARRMVDLIRKRPGRSEG